LRSFAQSHQTARPGRQRAEQTLLVHRPVLRSDAVTRLHYPKISMPTVHCQEVGLWFAKTLAEFEINDIAALPPLFCYNS
jgi:hypothetical protein